MQLKSVLAIGLLCAVSLVDADFFIITSTFAIRQTFEDADDASSWVADKSSRAASALSTYETHVTADPAYASVTSAVEAFLATRTDVPPAVTADDTTTTFRTQPPWYTALPSDIQSYYSGVQAAEISIFEEVVNAAPRPTAGMGCRGAAGFAAVGALGARALLF